MLKTFLNAGAFVTSVIICVTLTNVENSLSYYDSITNKIKQIQDASIEVIYDNTVFDDAPLQRYVEPIRQKLEKIRKQKLRDLKIAEEQQNNRMTIALTEDLTRSGQNCPDLKIAVNLSARLDENCQFVKIRDVCLEANEKVEGIFTEAQGPERFLSNMQTLKYLIALEHGLSNKLERVSRENRSCPAIYKEALTSQLCISTYEKYFDEFRESISNNCDLTTINESIERFISDKRDFDFASSTSLSMAINAHVKSRDLEIKLAERLKYINDARLQIEEALGVNSTNATTPRGIASDSKTGPK